MNSSHVANSRMVSKSLRDVSTIAIFVYRIATASCKLCTWHSVVQAKKCSGIPLNSGTCGSFSLNLRKGTASSGVADLSSNCVWIAMDSLCIRVCVRLGCRASHKWGGQNDLATPVWRLLLAVISQNSGVVCDTLGMHAPLRVDKFWLCLRMGV